MAEDEPDSDLDGDQCMGSGKGEDEWSERDDLDDEDEEPKVKNVRAKRNGGAKCTPVEIQLPVLAKCMLEGINPKPRRRGTWGIP